MKKLLLAGGGHSHIQVLRKMIDTPIKEVEAVLISPSRFQYEPDLFPGYTEGMYNKEDIRIDLAELAMQAGVEWVEGAVLSVDPKQKLALSAGGYILPFDVISFDIGSLTEGMDKLPLSENIYTIKPNYQFVSSIDSLLEAGNVVIAGGSAAAIEISSTLQSRRQENGILNPITLMSHTRLLPDSSEKISRKLEEVLRNKKINILTGIGDMKVTKDSVKSAGQSIPFDSLLWINTPKAPDLFKLSKLPVNKEGYLSVEDTLQVKKHPFIFGAGECASYVNRGTAVNQGNVLYTNIKGYFQTGEGELYHPQKQDHILLQLGNEQGFAVYRNRHLHGKLVWFMRKKLNKSALKQLHPH